MLARKPGPQLALHPRQTVRGPAGQVAGERGHLEGELVLEVVGLGHDPAEQGWGMRWSEPFMQSRSSIRKSATSCHVVAGAAHERLGVVGQRGPVAVADREVLGAHGRTVRCLPDEGVLGHRRGHAAPHDGIVESGEAEDLGHLGDVAEHVGQVADLHDAPEGGAADEAHLQVPHDRLARGQELVHQDVPGPHAQPAGGGQRPEPALGLRAHLEVVVDHGHLPVEHEVGIAGVALEQRDQGVDQVHQGQAEVLVGLVPFPIPVRVRNDGNAAGGHDRQTTAWRRGR